MRSLKINSFTVILLGLILTGCASSPTEDDPLEGLNRNVYGFNKAIDTVAVKPLAQVYEAGVPLPVRSGAGRMFNNIEDIWVGANKFLQGKGEQGGTALLRVLINSSIGLFGYFDVASEMGLEHQNEDFGQTLAVWGVESGAYLVLPVFGPRTVRDAVALPLDMPVWSFVKFSAITARNVTFAARVLDIRSGLLGSDVILNSSLDEYRTVRDAYLQHRRYLIFDGNPPREDFGLIEPDDASAQQAFAATSEVPLELQ